MGLKDLMLAVSHSALARTGISGHGRRISQYHRARALPDWGLSFSRLGSEVQNPDVSIIIPSFNYADHLPAAFASAVSATKANSHLRTEVIVFDDRSTDTSYEVALRLGRESGISVRVIRPIWNVGLSSARNISLRHARGRYVFFLDADNTMTAQGLQTLHACAEANKADAAYGPIRRISPDGDLEGFMSDQPFDETRLRTRGNYIDAMALFCRESLLRIGGYDLNLLRLIGGHEDHDLWLRLAAARAVICFCPDSVVGDYFVKKDSMANSISQREYADGYRFMQTAIPEPPRHPDNGLVFDLGFHKGEDSQYYLDAGYRVVAVEADPVLHSGGLRRFSEMIESKQLTLVHAAVVGWQRRQAGDSISFHPHAENSLWGTASGSFRARNTHIHGKPHAPAVKVPTTSLEQLVARYGCPRFLKVDIEGMDVEVVNDLERLVALPPFISWETGKQSLAEVFTSHLRLYRLGYRHFRVVQQMGLHRPARHQGGPDRDVNLHEHASGPMPDRHPMRWRGVSYALTKYLVLFMVYRLVGPGSIFWWAERHRLRVINVLPGMVRKSLAKRAIPFPGWFDSHAALPLSFADKWPKTNDAAHL